MRLLHPAYLILLAAIPWFWHAARARRIDHRTRYLISVLLIMSVAGLQLRRGAEPLSVLFLLDRSGSMGQSSESALGRLNELSSGMRAGDRAGLIAFASDAVLDQGLSTSAPAATVSSNPTGAETDIGEAIRLARSTLRGAGSRRIVLISDGRDTRGRGAAEAAIAAAEGIPIDVATPDATPPGLASPVITHLSAPSVVRIGEPFALDAQVHANPGARVELVVSRDGSPALTRELTAAANGYTSAVFSDRSDRTGIVTYRASARSLDPGGDDFGDSGDAVGAAVAVTGETQILYVSTAPGSLAPLLAANRFHVTVSRPSSVPRSSAELEGYDGIVLDDVDPALLDPAQGRAIADHVEQRGGGLLVLGGPNSLEAAPVMESALGPILPVDLRPRSGRRAPSFALVIVFDKSGSMADRVNGVPKIELARQSVSKVAGVVPAGDALGVVAFDGRAVAVAPLATGRDAQALGDALRRLEPGGPTAIAPAVELARDWLRAPAANTFAKRHVLLISDGRSTPEDVARLEKAVRGGGFELSVVALGADSDRPLLSRLAGLTGGKAYFPEDLQQLPVLAAREASRVAGGQVVDEPFTVRASTHPILAGIDRSRLPRVGGYVVSAAKPGADAVLRSHLDDPILSAWRAGLGKVMVFAANLRGQWSSELRSWRDSGVLWVQAVHWLSRESGAGALDLTFEEQGGNLRINLDANDSEGGFLNRLDSQARVRGPDGQRYDVTLRQSAPGRYVGTTMLSEPGTYLVDVTARGSSGVSEYHLIRGFFWSADAERRRGPDRAALAQLAAAGGGRTLEAGDGPFHASRPPRYMDLWPWLTLAALLLFVGDDVARRTRLWQRVTAAMARTSTTSARGKAA